MFKVSKLMCVFFGVVILCKESQFFGFSREEKEFSYGFKNGQTGSGSPRSQWLDEFVQGVPGVDYPSYDGIPEGLEFACGNFSYAGYFADVQSGCQVYHVCYGDGQNYSFLCQNGTVFNQLHYVCDWWYNIDCGQSPNLYHFNKFSRIPLPVKPTLPIKRATQKLKDFSKKLSNTQIVGEFGGKKNIEEKNKTSSPKKLTKFETTNDQNEIDKNIYDDKSLSKDEFHYYDYDDDYYYYGDSKYAAVDSSKYFKFGNKVKRISEGKEECFCKCSC